MTDERFDLSPIQPDDAQVERMVGNITMRARAELERRARAQRVTVFELVAGWAKPALLAAASVAGVSVALLTMFERSNAEAPTSTTAYMPATELPATASDWYEEGRAPSVDELLVAGNTGESQ